MKKKRKINKQFFFRKQRSTIGATTIILNGFRKRGRMAAIFFNIEKDYNKTNKNIQTTKEQRKITYFHKLFILFLNTWEYMTNDSSSES